MSNDCLLSIVVPVHNAQETISTTLDSLLSQSVETLEIICIDDGSVDESPQILSDYQKRHPKVIRIISTQNQGAYCARYEGILAAKAPYVGFCDADDDVSPLMFETMLKRIKTSDADVCVCAYERVKHDGTVLVEMDQYDESEWLLANPSDASRLLEVNTALWNKVFKTDVIKHAPEIKSRQKISEDALLWCSIAPWVTKVAFCSKPLYRYAENEGGAMFGFVQSDIEGMMASWSCARESIPSDYQWLIDRAAFIHLMVSPTVLLCQAKASITHREWSVMRRNFRATFKKCSLISMLFGNRKVEGRMSIILPGAYLLFLLGLLPAGMRVFLSIANKGNRIW